MTSNATFPSIDQAIADGKLIERDPIRSTLPTVRHLYVTPEIADILDDADPEKGFPSVEATIITDRYMIGHLMVVSFTAKTDPPKSWPDLERMENLDEVWVMCFRKPKPGWRLLGRFFAENHFVALRAYDRHELQGNATYEAKAEEMIADWGVLFPGTDPHRANAAEEYVTGLCHDVSK